MPHLPVFRNFSLSLASRVAGLGANLVYVAITARHFSIPDVAVLATIGIYTMLLDIGKGLGLGTYLLKHLPKQSGQGDRRASSLVMTYLFYSAAIPAALALLSLAAVAPAAEYFLGSTESGPLLRLGVLLALLTVLTNTNILVFQAMEDFGMLATQTIVSSLAQRFFPVLPMLWLGLDMQVFLVWSCGLAAVGFLVSCAPIAGRAAGARLLAPAEFWQESRHFYYASLLRFGSTQIDQVIVAAMFSPAKLAVYYMLRRLYSMAVVLVNSLIDALVPDLSRQSGLDAMAARRRLRKWVRGALVAGAAGGTLLAGNGGMLVRLVLGEGYAEDPYLIVLFSLAAFSYLLFTLGQLDLMLFQAPQRCLRMALVAAGLNTVLGPLMAYVVGLRGLPFAMSISYLLGLELASRYPFWNQRRIWAGLGAILLAGLLASAARMVAGPWAQAIAVNALILLAGYFWIQRHRYPAFFT